MTSQEEYLSQVRRAMAGMDPSVRDDIVRELRSHVAESMAANGGNPTAAFAGLGSPQEVGRHYRAIYGYGRVYRALFALIGFLLAVPSIPVLVAGNERIFPYGLSIIFLVVVAAWLVWVSVAAGSRAGLIAGIAAFAGRVLAFAIAASTQQGAVVTPDGVEILLATSVALMLLGWLPGTAKQTWSGPRAEL